MYIYTYISMATCFCAAQNHSTGVCTTGAIRAVGAALENAGRVEICINDRWNTVCDNEWDNSDAQVVCRQLGLNNSRKWVV